MIELLKTIGVGAATILCILTVIFAVNWAHDHWPSATLGAVLALIFLALSLVVGAIIRL